MNWFRRDNKEKDAGEGQYGGLWQRLKNLNYNYRIHEVDFVVKPGLTSPDTYLIVHYAINQTTISKAYELFEEYGIDKGQVAPSVLLSGPVWEISGALDKVTGRKHQSKGTNYRKDGIYFHINREDDNQKALCVYMPGISIYVVANEHGLLSESENTSEISKYIHKSKTNNWIKAEETGLLVFFKTKAEPQEKELIAEELNRDFESAKTLTDAFKKYNSMLDIITTNDRYEDIDIKFSEEICPLGAPGVIEYIQKLEHRFNTEKKCGSIKDSGFSYQKEEEVQQEQVQKRIDLEYQIVIVSNNNKKDIWQRELSKYFNFKKDIECIPEKKARSLNKNIGSSFYIVYRIRYHKTSDHLKNITDRYGSAIRGDKTGPEAMRDAIYKILKRVEPERYSKLI